ncbi:MAG: DNA polymerase III subunit gamma/tau, partial [Pseudohongiella sp.]
MSYQVLARKWRPQNFSEMAGQAHVLQTLTHALEQQRLHHAYLFTGTRGVGKTTVARILARCLNCEQGITATPCGQCNACREISEGRFIDLIEVDAASRTKVEDTRDLLDNVQYAPARGRFKVYLIDEVHMLSGHSFNALLKTLEEPPPHVKFLLATTDPQKLPVTVLSRCLQFHLKNLAPAQIVTYLQSVLAAEQIDHEEDALWQLARAAAGSMRDALTLLDQSISFGGGSVQVASVTSLLGTPDHAAVFAFMEALAHRDGSGLMSAVAQCAENNPDYGRLLEQMLSVCHRLALAQVMPDAIDNSEGDREQIKALAGAFAAEDVQLYYQICVQTLQDMPHSPEARACFEMGLLRMLAFSPDVFAGAVLPGAGSEKKKPESITAPEPTTASASKPEPEPVFQPE